MNVFTERELEYLKNDRRLGRIATVNSNGMPHIAPVGWSLAQQDSVIEISGREFAETKKFRDVKKTRVAAIVIDDVLPPWRPRGVEIRGLAEAIEHPQPLIRLHPQRIVSWGLPPDGRLDARDIG